MKHICIAAPLGAGKDTLADYLARVLNESKRHGVFERTAFARPLKKMYMDLLGVDQEFVETWKRKDEVPPDMLMNVRKSLQWIGDGMRQIKASLWIDAAFRGENPKIIADMRYINEAQANEAQGGTNVLLWRPGFLNKDPHPSEAQIRPLIIWCLRTNQNGPIKIPEDKLTPSRSPLALLIKGLFWVLPFLDHRPPQGMEHFHYFLRNDGDADMLRTKAHELLDFLINTKWQS